MARDGLNRVLTESGALQEAQRQNQQQVQATVQQQTGQAETFADVLEPVVSWEKTDIEFWVQLLQLLVLVLILMELRNG